MRGVGDRAAKWMRYIARALALIWAVLWTLSVRALLVIAHGMATMDYVYAPSLGPWMMSEGLGFWLIVALLVLIGWVSAAIPWRWEAIGGVVLVLESLVVATPLAVMFASLAKEPTALGAMPAVLRTMPLAPLVAGSLFLASWWRSRRAGTP